MMSLDNSSHPPCSDVAGEGVRWQKFLCTSATVVLAVFIAVFPVHAQVDTDWDFDGILNDDDNCPVDANPGQEDIDGNGVGDLCDDKDADGNLDIMDNCPLVANPAQVDTDEDGIGDECDPDTDNDGVLDVTDNCIFTPNTDQMDDDFDGLGNPCDGDFIAGEVVRMFEAEVLASKDILMSSEVSGRKGMISKLSGNGGVLRRVSNAISARQAGLIDVDTFTGELERALDKLDDFDDQVSAKSSNGQLDPDDAESLMMSSEIMRMTIEDLIWNPPPY